MRYPADPQLAVALATQAPDAVHQALAAIGPTQLEAACLQVIAHDTVDLLPVLWDRLEHAQLIGLARNDAVLKFHPAVEKWWGAIWAQCIEHHSVAMVDALIACPLPAEQGTDTRSGALHRVLLAQDPAWVDHLLTHAPADWSLPRPEWAWAMATAATHLPTAEMLQAHVPIQTLSLHDQGQLLENICQVVEAESQAAGLVLLGFVLAQVDRAALAPIWSRAQHLPGRAGQMASWAEEFFPDAERAYQAHLRQQALAATPAASPSTRRHRP